MIADNSTLSNFARSSHFAMLLRLFPEGLWTTADVIAEIERGVGKYPALQAIMDSQGEWLRVVEELTPGEAVTRQQLISRHRGIRRGADSGILAVARARGWTVLTDDYRAGKGMVAVARQEGLAVMGTKDLPDIGVRERVITTDQARQIVVDMAVKARFQVKDSS
jgi:predicted nucleic acid-binding protein